MIAAAVVFWISIGVLAYVYVGYPLICRILGGLLRRDAGVGDIVPSVTVVIAARNEAAHIVETVRNKLVQDYPADRLEVIVVSDASTDGTDALVAEIAAGEGAGRVRLLRQETRAGKTAALGLAAPEAKGEILVFSDANSLFGPGTVRSLVAPFADSRVGYVSGRMVYRAADGSLTGRGCSTYMAYENWLRSAETRVGSVVGVDGGVDAVRADLFEPMLPDQQPDFVLPLAVVARNLRVVYAADALVYEDALQHGGDEFRMRVRVILRAWHGLRDMAGLLDPRRSGIFAWQLFSHKWLRYLAPLFLVSALAANAVLAFAAPVWRITLGVQIALYVLAGLGFLTRGRRLAGPLGLPYYFCIVNAAALTALFRFLRGERQAIWSPRT